MKNSSQWIKRILTLSLSINLIFFFFFSYIVYKKGGSSYLIKRTKSIFVENNKTASAFRSNYPLIKQTSSYYHKKSLFELLPDTDKEIIFLGDSITDWCRWSELFQNLNIKNRGIGGDRTDSVLLRLDEIISSSPDKIFIMIGINDLGQGIDVLDIVKNYKKIIKIISDKSPGTKIYIQSLLPVNRQLLAKFYPKSYITGENIRKLNNFLEDLSSEYQLDYINLYDLFKGDEDQLDKKFTYDGLHLRGEGYLIWKSFIEQDVLN